MLAGLTGCISSSVQFHELWCYQSEQILSACCSKMSDLPSYYLTIALKWNIELARFLLNVWSAFRLLDDTSVCDQPQAIGGVNNTLCYYSQDAVTYVMSCRVNWTWVEILLVASHEKLVSSNISAWDENPFFCDEELYRIAEPIKNQTVKCVIESEQIRLIMTHVALSNCASFKMAPEAIEQSCDFLAVSTTIFIVTPLLHI